MKQEFTLSPRATLSVNTTLESFSTGTDSPVNEDSLTFKFTASINLRSAPMVSPSSMTTTSPGTKLEDFTLNLLPSLITVDSGLDIFFKASSEVCALSS